MEKRLLTPHDAAIYLGWDNPKSGIGWLAKSRMLSPGFVGPSYVKLGGSVRYDVKDLDEYIEINKIKINNEVLIDTLNLAERAKKTIEYLEQRGVAISHESPPANSKRLPG